MKRILSDGDVVYLDSRIEFNLRRGVVVSKPLVKYSNTEYQRRFVVREKGKLMLLDLVKLYLAGLFDPFEALHAYNECGLLDVSHEFSADERRIVLG